jgi:hypothetical protein
MIYSDLKVQFRKCSGGERMRTRDEASLSLA